MELHRTDWNPIETAPKDSTSFKVPPNGRYDRCFFQGEDGYEWWVWYTHGEDNYGFGPKPTGWLPE